MYIVSTPYCPRNSDYPFYISQITITVTIENDMHPLFEAYVSLMKRSDSTNLATRHLRIPGSPGIDPNTGQPIFYSNTVPFTIPAGLTLADVFLTIDYVYGGFGVNPMGKFTIDSVRSHNELKASKIIKEGKITSF
jgi:hypothetical protein